MGDIYHDKKSPSSVEQWVITIQWLVLSSMGISGSNLWSYVSTIFQAIFSWEIPWNLGLKNRPKIYGIGSSNESDPEIPIDPGKLVEASQQPWRQWKLHHNPRLRLAITWDRPAAAMNFRPKWHFKLDLIRIESWILDLLWHLWHFRPLSLDKDLIQVIDF